MSQRTLLPADTAQAIKLADAVQVSASGIVSRTVLQTPEARVVLFTFADGQELTSHSSRHRALVQILDGGCEFFFAGKWQDLTAGMFLHLPPGHTHAVRASSGPFSMVLTLGAEPAADPTFPMRTKTESTDLTHFDVREIPCRVKHAQILQRWLELPVGKHFVLINDHDPIPLRFQFDALFPQAFDWEYLECGPEEFRVRITKRAAVTMPTGAAVPRGCGEPAKPVGSDAHEVDARGLEPPEPLMRILNALESLPHGSRLRAITDRQPCHLFGEAEQRGFHHECTEQPNGSWITILTRR